MVGEGPSAGRTFPFGGHCEGVLTATFLHLPGIGPATESDLWELGLGTWSALRASRTLAALPEERRRRIEHELDASQEALRARAAAYFARRLPRGEHWRIYPDFAESTAFLDIETTGLSPYEGTVTVVTVHGGGRTRTFVADEDLEELPAYLRGFQVLVTFNGSLFDVPFLEVRFPALVVPEAHVDLRFLLRRLGFVGGLKKIEQQLALGRRDGVEGIHGLDAVRLWEAHRAGSASALDRLVRYNRADTVNLEPLLRFAVAQLTQRLRPADRFAPLEAPGRSPLF